MRTERLRTGLLLAAGLLGPVLIPLPGVSQAEAKSEAAAEAAAQGTDKVITGDHTIGPDEVVEDVVVVGGTLTVLGRVTGDAVVVGGNLVLGESALVLGDALVTGGRIVDQGGRVRGEMRAMDQHGDAVSRDIERAVAEGIGAAEAGREAAREARKAGRDAAREAMREARREPSWLDPIQKGLVGLIQTLAFGLLLAGIGSVLIFYGRPYLETVSDTLRGNTLRSAGVGLAAGFLVIPAFVVLVVALAVSIIGIPFLLVAVPLYPLALAAAVAFGLLAAAHAIGERTADQRREIYDLRFRNSYAYLFTGLGMLVAPLLAASLIQMTGFLSFLGTLLKVVTWMVIWVAATAGFGAVILSRAGTRRTFVPPAPVEPTYEHDPLFDNEPAMKGRHV